ncbi:hypothetical protein B0H10DRAFT_2181186 [Mycena sp. CBHHK59/15]|nr:hypothetical protein B0H10DRAFT_2181186 [Mycena sp. CBHHK59/15]
MGLLGTRQQAATWEDIEPFYEELRKKFPNMGARGMVSKLRREHGLKVPEKFLLDCFKVVDPGAGVMDIITFDQHDKWKRFGLWLHVGLDPFAGRIAWLKIRWTNRNSKLITSYYLEACRSIGGIPLITQSDLGTENNGIANCHTVTRQRLDPSLKGTLQHRWTSKTGMNVKPETCWSQLRRNWTPGFENLLDSGVNANLYDRNNPLQRLVFRWLAIPWLQAELDTWVQHYNSTSRRADKHKILPHGIPDMSASKPRQFGTTDYKVIVSPELFDEMETQWAPSDNPVFLLVPPAFEQQAQKLYGTMGSPPVTYDNLWDLYGALLNAFQAVDIDAAFHEVINAADAHFEGPVDLIENQVPLGYGADESCTPIGDLGYEYLGGLLDPPRAGNDGNDYDREYADLTPSEDSDAE